MLEFIIIALFVTLLGYVIYNISDIIIIMKNEDEENEESEENVKMTSKEALDILKNRISTLALNHKIGNRDIANLEIKDIVTSIETWVIPIFEKAQKQEKLLELYKELITAKDELISVAYFGDDYFDKRKKEKDLEQQIKELEK